MINKNYFKIINKQKLFILIYDNYNKSNFIYNLNSLIDLKLFI